MATTSSTTTTFAIFQSLLREAVNKDTALASATKAAMLARIDDLAREDRVVMDFSNVDSNVGQVTVDQTNKSIEVAIGVTGNNRVEWSLQTFSVPVTIAGTPTEKGFFTGHVGTSANALVADADISLQYRLSSTDTWKNFDRATVLESVTSIQFAANIADQVGATALPGLVLMAVQE